MTNSSFQVANYDQKFLLEFGPRSNYIVVNTFNSSSAPNRAALVDWWAQNASSVPEGAVIDFDDISIRKVADSTSLVDFPGAEPVRPASPEHMGAIGDGVADDSAALIAYLTWCTSQGVNPVWTEGKTYFVTQNLPSFLSYIHEGKAFIRSGSDTFHVGAGWQGQSNVIYVGAVDATDTAANDGLTPDRPRNLTNGWNDLQRQIRIAPAARWRLQFAAGTYSNGPSRRLENFPATDYRVEIWGAPTVSGVPTTIFNSWTSNVFRKLDGAQGLQLHFKDFLFQNQTAGSLLINHGCDVLSENLHFNNFSGGPAATYRRCKVNHTGGRCENGDGGITQQACYGDTGDNSGLTNTNGVVFNNITSPDGLAVCVDYSRGTVGYTRQCSFGKDAACDIHLSESRLGRIRTQDNTHGAFNTAIFRQETALTIWNDDLNNIDDWTGSGAVLGDTPIKSVPGSFISRIHNGRHRAGHLAHAGEPYQLTGTTRTQLPSGQWSPFRMPGVWLMNPLAMGWVEYEILIPTAETVTFEISGAASGTGQRLAYINIVTGGYSRWLVRFEITGPLGGGTQGRFVATAIGPNTIQTNFNSTGTLSNSALTYASLDPIVFRTYVTRSVGTGNLDVLRMNSDVSV